MDNVIWYFKQLFPLKYRTKYIKQDGDGKNVLYFVEWRMWLGRCYNVNEFSSELNVDCTVN